MATQANTRAASRAGMAGAKKGPSPLEKDQLPSGGKKPSVKAKKGQGSDPEATEERDQQIAGNSAVEAQGSGQTLASTDKGPEMGANENTEEALEGAPRKEKEADASVCATGTEGQAATLESPNVSREKTREVAKGPTPENLEALMIGSLEEVERTNPPSESDEEERVSTNEEGLTSTPRNSLAIAREDRGEIPRTTRRPVPEGYPAYLSGRNSDIMRHLGADGQAPYEPGEDEGSHYGYDHNGNGSRETPSYGHGGGGGGDPPPPPVGGGNDERSSCSSWYEQWIHEKVDGDREKIPEVKGAKPTTPGAYDGNDDIETFESWLSKTLRWMRTLWMVGVTHQKCLVARTWIIDEPITPNAAQDDHHSLIPHPNDPRSLY
ncbi:hypothetical protein BV22DRAFT_1052273 [Leucogyrophana mollusca]|uniref:Uncharacterized protein n=1 Tax=Leucogyrophana mollusca TaxID=85980 RepID=A0ACB8AVZ1_9AGAM|nr:hypothetical protein BV22DRAFT_1052273 [Leucogyrophana mollusca]